MAGITYDALMRDCAVALTAAGIDNTRLEARLLMSRASGLSIEELISHGRDEATTVTVDGMQSLTARRIKREPMAYILGEREFWGLTFKVTSDVLVPRPDSETLIEAATALFPDRRRSLRLLDLGVGSGCLLLTLLREFPNAEGVGFEISPPARAVAEENARALGVERRTRFVTGDWNRADWTTSLGGPFDLVVSNPPYIASAEIGRLMPEVARYEPRGALDGGADGLDAYRQIAAGARKLITSEGWLLVEVGEGQAIDISAIFSAAGWTPGKPWKDLAGVDRVVPGNIN